MGVIGMRVRQGDEVVRCDFTRDGADLLIVTDTGHGKRTKLDRSPARAGAPWASLMVGADDELLLISSAGVTIGTAIRNILGSGPRRPRCASRTSTRARQSPPSPPSQRDE